MLASISSQHVESDSPDKGNLEASVRSRHGSPDRTKGDLIEAGLNEPAGWRARLWGLCLGRPVRGSYSAETDYALGRLIACIGGECRQQHRAVKAASISISAIATRRGLGGPSADGMPPADVSGAR